MRIFLNNVAVITGGSSGIGKEVAKRLVAGGASVVIGGRDADKLAQAADEIDPSGERVRLFRRQPEHRIHSPVASRCAYSAANAGVHALTRNLAIKLTGANIRINTVAPAVVETPIFGTFMDAEQVKGNATQLQ